MAEANSKEALVARVRDALREVVDPEQMPIPFDLPVPGPEIGGSAAAPRRRAGGRAPVDLHVDTAERGAGPPVV